MCSVVQKDVLIELLANTQANLNKRLSLPLNEDQIFLAKLRNEIYRSSHEALDFDDLSQCILSISQKYQHLPRL